MRLAILGLCATTAVLAGLIAFLNSDWHQAHVVEQQLDAQTNWSSDGTLWISFAGPIAKPVTNTKLIRLAAVLEPVKSDVALSFYCADLQADFRHIAAIPRLSALNLWSAGATNDETCRKCRA